MFSQLRLILMAVAMIGHLVSGGAHHNKCTMTVATDPTQATQSLEKATSPAKRPTSVSLAGRSLDPTRILIADFSVDREAGIFDGVMHGIRALGRRGKSSS